MVDRTVFFNGVDLKKKFGLLYSSFDEELPAPKVKTVDIPAGIDLDITEAVGPVSFSNGKHEFVFLLLSDDIIDVMRNIKAMIHGKAASYALSWDPGYTYQGRWEVDVKHLLPNADLLTMTVDRYPWKFRSESVDVNCHPKGSYKLKGSERYSNLSITTKQHASVKVGSAAAVSVNAGTTAIAGQAYGDTVVSATVDSWYYYITDAGNMVVKPGYLTINGTDADFDNTVFVLNGTDLDCPNEPTQHVTLKYTRKDL